MKNLKKAAIIISGLVIVFTTATFIACSGNVGEDQIIGTWVMDSAKAGSDKITIEQYLAQAKATTPPTIIFKEDGTVVKKNIGTASDGTWEKKDSLYIVSENNTSLEDLEIMLKGDKFTVNQSGADLTFKKEETKQQ
ncbi:MAG: hypothetical protein RSD88_00610 [Anaerovoracaceae bacterium]